MKMTTMEKAKEVVSFTERAKKAFNADPNMTTYTDSGYIDPGKLFAIRWGMGNDCIVVFKIDEDFEPINFQQILLGAK